MLYIEPEQLTQAREIDLLTYLQTYAPNELIRQGANAYKMRSVKGLKISNGKWCWWGNGNIGGRSALDFLIKVKGYTLHEAATIILEQAAIVPPVFDNKAVLEQPKEFVLPKASRCATAAVNYLHNRGIEWEIINYCMRTGRLYESYPHHNVVFVGHDEKGKERYVTRRGIGTDFKGDVSGSTKKYAFNLTFKNNSKTVHVFECAIDALSYASLVKLHGYNWTATNYLSLGGTPGASDKVQPILCSPQYKDFLSRWKKEEADVSLSQSAEKFFSQTQLPALKPDTDKFKKAVKAMDTLSVPMALSMYLERHPHIKNVCLHLDNDKAGRLTTNAILAALPKRYEVKDKPPKVGKDCNDTLMAYVNSKQIKKIRSKLEV